MTDLCVSSCDIRSVVLKKKCWSGVYLRLKITLNRSIRIKCTNRVQVSERLENVLESCPLMKPLHACVSVANRYFRNHVLAQQSWLDSRISFQQRTTQLDKQQRRHMRDKKCTAVRVSLLLMFTWLEPLHIQLWCMENMCYVDFSKLLLGIASPPWKNENTPSPRPVPLLDIILGEWTSEHTSEHRA